MEKKSEQYLIFFFFLVIVFLIYFPTFSFNFVNFDDDINIFENPYLSPTSFDKLLNFWLSPYQHLYIPITCTLWWILSFISECCINFEGPGNTNPFVFHLANFFFHFLNALLVFSILKLVVRITSPNINSFADKNSNRKKVAIAAGALLFITHPAQVETVAWATGMRDLTGAFFSFLALRQFLLYTIKKNPFKFPESSISNKEVIGSEKKIAITGFIAFVYFFMALLAKPSSVAIPIVIGFLITSILDNQLKKIALPLLIWLMASILCVWWTKIAQPLNLNFVPPVWARVIITFDTIGFYAVKLIVPFSLTMDYGRSPSYVLNLGWKNINLAVGLITVILFFRTLSKKNMYRIPLALFLIFTLPVSGLLPFNFQAYSTVSDRYLYMAIFGPSIGITFFILSVKKNIFIGFCYVLLFFFSVLSSYQVKHWQNSTTLFEHAVNANGNGYLARIGLGLELEQNNKIEEAIEQNQFAVKINPDFIQAYFNLGNIYAKQKKTAQAIEYYKKTLRMKVDFEDGYINLGVILRDEGKLNEAIKVYEKGITFNKNSIKLLNHLASALTKQNKFVEASEIYLRIVKIVPNSSQAHNNLGIAYGREGKFKNAEESFFKALSIDPKNADVLYNLQITREQKY